MASHSNKNKKRKRKKENIEKPPSRNLTVEDLLSEQPYYKQPIKSSKRKKLNNKELLQVLPFYDDGARQRAHKKCLTSCDAEFIVKNSLRDSLFSSKKSIKGLFNNLLREKKWF